MRSCWPLPALTLALTWSSPPLHEDHPPITGLYENTTEGFSVTLPEGWVGHENETKTPLLSIETMEDFPQADAQLWIFTLSDDSSAEAWADGQIGQYGPDEIRSSEPAIYDGSDSGRRVTMATTQESSTVTFEVWTVVVRGSQVFLLRVRTEEESWPAVQPQANAFTGSFTLLTPMPFGASREDSLFQYWGEIVTLDPALSRRGAGDLVGSIFSGLVKLDTDL